MKDLKAIREKCEREIKLAEIANGFEAVFGIEPTVFDCMGKTHLSVKVNNYTAKRILSEIKAEKEFLINDTASGTKNPINALFRLSSERGFADRCSTLEIRFFNGGIWYSLKMEINGNDILEPFFADGTRNISDCERSTYKPTKRGICVRNYEIPCKRFNGKQIAYYGGYYVLTDCAMINNIIEAIKNS